VFRKILYRIGYPLESDRIRSAGGLAVAAAGAFLALTSCVQLTGPEAATGVKASEPGFALRRGDFRETVRLHGAVGAVQSKMILAPRLSGQMGGMMVITKIVGNGTKVREGDLLVEFDSQNQLRTVLDRQAEYDNLVQQIKKRQADQVTATAADETELKGAEVDLQTARVEMRKNEVISSIQAEINKQNLAEAEAKLKQVKSTFALKRDAAAAELRILEIQRDRAQKAVAYAQGNIEKMSIRSPLSGLVVLSPIYKGTRQVDPQEGDEVRPGGGIMLVVNPSAMQVTARLNQVDVSKVHVGQAAEVLLDAYPDLSFPGKVERISAISTASQYSRRIRYFAAVISIQGSNPKLLPDLTAAVDVQLQVRKNVLLLPREAVVMQQGQAMVEVPGNGRSELRPVRLGPRNECEVVIESGLQEGVSVSLHPQVAAGADKRLPE